MMKSNRFVCSTEVVRILEGPFREVLVYICTCMLTVVCA